MNNRPHNIRLDIESNLKNLRQIETLSATISSEMDLSQDQLDNLSIAFTEAVGNAITHGNKNDPEKIVHININIYPDKVCISITDQGAGFDPTKLDDPLNPKNMMKENGRGIFIMEALMDEVSHSFDENGTTISFTLKKEKQA